MLISLILTAAVAVALLCYKAVTEAHTSRLLFAVADDSDMKIAGDLSSIGSRHASGSEVDRAAQEFIRQKENGNIEKGKALGATFAQELLGSCTRVLQTIPSSEGELVRTQCKILYTFAVNKVIEEMSPNSVVAHATMSNYYQQIKEQDASLYRLVNDSTAFSLYILCSRSMKTGDRSTYGEVFAKMCEEEQNPIYAKMGDDLFEFYYNMCADRLIAIDYIR